VTTGYETTAPVATGYETGAYTTGTTTGTTGGYETGSYDAGYTATRAYDDTVGGYTEPGQGDLPR
jgi:hypothetical protein